MNIGGQRCRDVRGGQLVALTGLPLGKYPRNAALSIVISNPVTGQVLLARQLVRQPADARQGQLPVSKWQAAGIKKIAVTITCHPKRSHFFTDKLLLNLRAPAAP